MNRFPPTARCAIGAAGAALLMSGAGAGEPLRVAQLDCRDGVQLSARATPLSQVLRRMSEVMDFRLDYWAHDDPPVDLDARQTPLELMNALSLRANMMVRYAADRRCPGQWRVTRVWVLPGASSSDPPKPSTRGDAPTAAKTTREPIENDPNREHLLAHGVQTQPNAAPVSPSVASTSAASAATARAAVIAPTLPQRATR